MNRRRRLEAAMPWIVTIGIFVVWEAACAAFDVPQFVLPRPTVIAVSAVEWAGPIWYHASHTLFTTVLGFAFAVVGGYTLIGRNGVATSVSGGPMMLHAELPVGRRAALFCRL